MLPGLVRHTFTHFHLELGLAAARIRPEDGAGWKQAEGIWVPVDRLSLRVRPGSTVALVGESGSGKTTLGRAVLGLAPVTGGTIRYDGRDIVLPDDPSAVLRAADDPALAARTGDDIVTASGLTAFSRERPEPSSMRNWDSLTPAFRRKVPMAAAPVGQEPGPPVAPPAAKPVEKPRRGLAARAGCRDSRRTNRAGRRRYRSTEVARHFTRSKHHAVGRFGACGRCRIARRGCDAPHRDCYSGRDWPRHPAGRRGSDPGWQDRHRVA